MTHPTALLVGTLDTKGAEYQFVKERLLESGIDVLLMDVGVLAEPAVQPDIPAATVADVAGTRLEDLRSHGEGMDSRRNAIETMARGAALIARRLVAEERVDGALGLGGSGGSALVSSVLRELPFGMPKLLVSTMASGDVRPYIGTSDILLLHSVADIAGVNRISRPVLTNAAAALAGMLRNFAKGRPVDDAPAVAITMLGVTTPGVRRVCDALRAWEFEPVVFHAVGSGGAAMESLISAGAFEGVIDYTPKEVTDELLGGIFVAGEQRLKSASNVGIPQVFVPGAVEVINFGAAETVPLGIAREGRPTVRHNAEVTAVRATARELELVAAEFATRLNISPGLLEVILPRDGFDSYDEPGGPFENAAEDDVFRATLMRQLRPDVPAYEVDGSVNAPEFADVVATAFRRLHATWKQKQGDSRK